MACVAQALLITWLAKKMLESEGFSVGLVSDSSALHLKRKIKPYTGLGTVNEMSVFSSKTD